MDVRLKNSYERTCQRSDMKKAPQKIKDKIYGTDDTFRDSDKDKKLQQEYE